MSTFPKLFLKIGIQHYKLVLITVLRVTKCCSSSSYRISFQIITDVFEDHRIN